MSKTDYFLTVYITSWDGPSQEFVKHLDGLNHRIIDVDHNPEIAAQQKIRAVPTTQIYNGAGELVYTKIGAAPRAMIEEWIKDV